MAKVYTGGNPGHTRKKKKMGNPGHTPKTKAGNPNNNDTIKIVGAGPGAERREELGKPRITGGQRIKTERTRFVGTGAEAIIERFPTGAGVRRAIRDPVPKTVKGRGAQFTPPAPMKKRAAPPIKGFVKGKRTRAEMAGGAVRRGAAGPIVGGARMVDVGGGRIQAQKPRVSQQAATAGRMKGIGGVAQRGLKGQRSAGVQAEQPTGILDIERERKRKIRGITRNLKKKRQGR